MSQTYRSCTQGGGCNTYNVGGSSGNLGAFTPGWTPGGGRGGGPSAADLAKQKESQKQGCFKGVETAFLQKCEVEVTQIYRDNMTSCNTGIAIGAAAGVAGTVGLAALALVTAPVSVPLMIIGAATFSTVAVGGAYVAADNQYQCKDRAEWTKADNLQICKNKIRDAQNVACKSFL